jgi:hypothetical protein
MCERSEQIPEREGFSNGIVRVKRANPGERGILVEGMREAQNKNIKLCFQFEIKYYFCSNNLSDLLQKGEK